MEGEELNICNEQKKYESGSLTFSVALFKQLRNKPLYITTAAVIFICTLYAHKQIW